MSILFLYDARSFLVQHLLPCLSFVSHILASGISASPLHILASYFLSTFQTLQPSFFSPHQTTKVFSSPFFSPLCHRLSSVDRAATATGTGLDPCSFSVSFPFLLFPLCLGLIRHSIISLLHAWALGLLDCLIYCYYLLLVSLFLFFTRRTLPVLQYTKYTSRTSRPSRTLVIPSPPSPTPDATQHSL